MTNSKHFWSREHNTPQKNGLLTCTLELKKKNTILLRFSEKTNPTNFFKKKTILAVWTSEVAISKKHLINIIEIKTKACLINICSCEGKLRCEVAYLWNTALCQVSCLRGDN